MPVSPGTWFDIYLFPLLTTLVFWGVLTLILLWMNARCRFWQRLSLFFMTVALIPIHYLLWVGRDDSSMSGHYWAFGAGMLIWTWHELAFYSGVLTGPWRQPCPPGVNDWQRFWYAFNTHLYHEIAVILELLVLWWLHQECINITGMLAFVLMWSLQQSAKLNVFLGIPHLNVTLLPEHLRYLGSFWHQRPLNPFFWPSLLVIILLAGTLWLLAGLPDTIYHR